MENFQGVCKINLSIDDVNPKAGWGIIGTPVQKYLDQLNKDYGVKTTLFIPANHHGNARLSENKGWINELKSLKYLEFGAHGYYHSTNEPNKWGECEFGELTDSAEISTRIELMMREWNTVGYAPKVWKSPGWLTSRQSVKHLSEWFHTAVIHPQHNHNLMWKIPTITATDFSSGFPNMDCNMFILSHIHGKHDNVWNENFYNWIRATLDVVIKNIPTEMCFINEFQ